MLYLQPHINIQQQHGTSLNQRRKEGSSGLPLSIINLLLLLLFAPWIGQNLGVVDAHLPQLSPLLCSPILNKKERKMNEWCVCVCVVCLLLVCVCVAVPNMTDVLCRGVCVWCVRERERENVEWRGVV